VQSEKTAGQNPYFPARLAVRLAVKKAERLATGHLLE
jgi:hypothetical protein